MPCPPGQHQHMGAKGKMLACHPTSTKHTNERTRQYHEMALTSKRSEGMTEDFGIEDEDKTLIPPETKERIQANNKKIKQALKQLTRGKFKALFVPLTAILWTYDGMSSKIADYKQKAKSKHDKQMADVYEKTVNEIIEEMPDIDVDSWGEDTVKALTQGYREKVDSLKEQIKAKGTKDCPEYAQYRAYRDYLLMADEKQEKIHRRVMSERAKTQQTLAGTRSANQRQPKLRSGGGAMSKKEFFEQYPQLSFGKSVLSPLEEWEQIQARMKDREEEKERKEVEELGSRVRTSNPNKSRKK